MLMQLIQCGKVVAQKEVGERMPTLAEKVAFRNEVVGEEAEVAVEINYNPQELKEIEEWNKKHGIS